MIPVCKKCKGRGWVFKDVLAGTTQPCECRKEEESKDISSSSLAELFFRNVKVKP